MATVDIKLPDEALVLTVSGEQAQVITKWFDEAGADGVLTVNDPRLGEVWVQKRHVIRIAVRS